MTTHETAGCGAGAPIACDLTSGDLADQRERWQRLGEQALAGREQTADGLRIAFRAGDGVEAELRALVAVETECCAWADWRVEPGPEQVVLDVRATGDGVPALHNMFTTLQAAPRTR
jgi:hypothetical protein